VQMELMTDESGGYEYNGMVDKAVISLTRRKTWAWARGTPWWPTSITRKP
jgi:hypothetical protein